MNPCAIISQSNSISLSAMYASSFDISEYDDKSKDFRTSLSQLSSSAWSSARGFGLVTAMTRYAFPARRVRTRAHPIPPAAPVTRTVCICGPNLRSVSCGVALYGLCRRLDHALASSSLSILAGHGDELKGDGYPFHSRDHRVLRRRRVPSRFWLEFVSAISRMKRLPDQAARSIVGSERFSLRVCQPSTLRIVICPEASRAQNNMAAVSAEGRTV